MTKSRDAIVADFAGLTRDRHYGDGRHGEREFIVATLNHFDWNISRASVVLGVERTNLHKKMRSLGIKRDV